MAARLSLPPSRKREGGIELLRIVCMLLILAHHMVYHSGAIHTPHPVNRVLARFAFVGGQTGVNCFVLITGYFLAPFKARRLASVTAQAVFYSLGLTLLAKALGWAQPTQAQMVDSVLIFSRTPYWFVAMYGALTALLPALQPMAKSLSRRQHGWILLVGGAALSLLPTITLPRPSSPFFHNLTWFCYLYLLGAYFRKYPLTLARRPGIPAAVFLTSAAFMALSSLWGEGRPELFSNVASRYNFFADKNALPQLICSCALFLTFAGRSIPPYGGLTTLSGAAFGVYLIHDHPLLRPLLWGRWLGVGIACQKEGFWLLMLWAPAALFLAGAAVDSIRKYALEKPLFTWLGPRLDRVDAWLGQEQGGKQP